MEIQRKKARRNFCKRLRPCRRNSICIASCSPAPFLNYIALILLFNFQYIKTRNFMLILMMAAYFQPEIVVLHAMLSWLPFYKWCVCSTVYVVHSKLLFFTKASPIQPSDVCICVCRCVCAHTTTNKQIVRVMHIYKNKILFLYRIEISEPRFGFDKKCLAFIIILGVRIRFRKIDIIVKEQHCTGIGGTRVWFGFSKKRWMATLANQN